MDSTYESILEAGGKSNSLGRSAEILDEVLKDSSKLPELYACISSSDAWVRMRAIDTLEKVFRIHPEWAKPFTEDMFADLLLRDQPSIQWHLVQIFRNIELSKAQDKQVIAWLKELLSTTSVDWIVAANAMDSLALLVKEGLFPKTGLIELLEIQQQHKSKSIVKRSNRLLAEL